MVYAFTRIFKPLIVSFMYIYDSLFCIALIAFDIEILLRHYFFHRINKLFCRGPVEMPALSLFWNA